MQAFHCVTPGGRWRQQPVRRLQVWPPICHSPPHFCLFLSPCIEAETRKKERPKIGPVFPAAVSREKVGTIFTSFLEFLAAVSLGDGGPPLCYHLPFCVRRLPAAASSKLPLFFPFFFPFFKNVFSNYYFQPLFFFFSV